MIANNIEEIKLALNIDSLTSLSPDSKIYQLLNNEDATTEPELLDIFYSYVRSQRPHTIVEIGTYKGISTLILSEALRENNYGTIYTIDNGNMIGNGTAKDLFRNHNLSNVVFIEKDSVRAFEEWGRADIEFLYIDSDHSYAAACIDFALWSRFVTPNGLIAIHDTRTRLLRHFPDDYIYPLECYDILNISNVENRPSGQEWEGCAFIKKRPSNLIAK